MGSPHNSQKQMCVGFFFQGDVAQQWLPARMMHWDQISINSKAT